MKVKTGLLIGSLLALAGVLLGAFGSHALEQRVSADRLAVWETAVQYHLIHAIALVLIALVADRWRRRRAFRIASWALLVGIALFSGSIYAYTLGAPRFFVFFAPFGGVALMIAWALVAWGAWGLRDEDSTSHQ